MEGLIRIARLDNAIIGIDAKEPRIVYSIPLMINIIQEEHNIGEEEATKFIEDEIINIDPPHGYHSPIFCWQSPLSEEEYVDRFRDPDEIREAFGVAVSAVNVCGDVGNLRGLLTDDEMNNLLNEIYKVSNDIHNSQLQNIKKGVTDILDSGATGEDVMLDLINLLKRIV